MEIPLKGTEREFKKPDVLTCQSSHAMESSPDSQHWNVTVMELSHLSYIQ